MRKFSSLSPWSHILLLLSYLQTCFYGDYSQLPSFIALVLFYPMRFLFSFYLSSISNENITQLDFPFTWCVCYFKIYKESENIFNSLNLKPNIFMLNCDCSDKFSVRNSFSFLSFPFVSPEKKKDNIAFHSCWYSLAIIYYNSTSTSLLFISLNSHIPPLLSLIHSSILFSPFFTWFPSFCSVWKLSTSFADVTSSSYYYVQDCFILCVFLSSHIIFRPCQM